MDFRMVNSEGNLPGGKSLHTVHKMFFLSIQSKVFGKVLWRPKCCKQRRNERKGQSCVAARVSSESLLFWRTHYFSLSHYSLLNQTMSAAWLPSIHSGFVGTWIADRPETWAEVWEGLCLIIQLCQRKVIAKNQRSQYFLKWIKQGNTYWRG